MKLISNAVYTLSILVFVLVLAVGARSDQDGNHDDRACRDSEHHAHNLKTPLKLVGGILVPGNPLHFDISWVDQGTERYFLAEAGNASVDVFDAENDLFLGRIVGFHGAAAQNDLCGRIDGMGPSGVLATSNNKLWVTDAHGMVKIFDLTNAQPPFANVVPIATVSTGARCRADELAFDPKDHVVIVGNPAENPPFAALISSNPPYNLLGKITFPDAGGLEQSLWDSELHGGRFLVNVPGTGDFGMVAVVNPKTIEVETTYATPDCAGSGLALGPFQHLLVGCSSGPLLVLNALNGHVLNTISQISGADEVWYNTGDGRFYAASNTAPNPVLGVIDAETNTFLQAAPSGPGAHSVSAFRETNHVFVPIGIPTATIPTDTCAIMFGFPPKSGCIAVYAHENKSDEDSNDHN